MKPRIQQISVMILCGYMMICLILDGQTALYGAAAGIDVCIKTVIPTLLPYIFLSSLLCGSIVGSKIPIVGKISRICGVPDGLESILLVGMIGGYPVGAKLIADAYRNGQLSKSAARRMISFCNNAGPSFIFGILSGMFSNRLIPWCLWGVHIISALIVGCILPIKELRESKRIRAKQVDVSAALQQSVKTVAQICGWIILFRILIAYLNKWFLGQISPIIQVLLTGMLELANGCIVLGSIPSEAIRLPVSAFMLSFGGLCVTMQTRSVTGELGLGIYIPGKLLQTVISLLLVIPATYFFYKIEPDIWIILDFAIMVLMFALILAAKLHQRKKVVAIP